MKKIAAGAFKAKCLSLMDDVRATKRPLLITSVATRRQAGSRGRWHRRLHWPAEGRLPGSGRHRISHWATWGLGVHMV